VRALRSASLPSIFGDFLVGLFAAARTEVLDAPDLVGAIDEVLVGLGDHETLVALPSLRIAFAYFPPRERERIARLVLARHGGDAAKAHAMVARLELSLRDVEAGVALDRAVAALAHRHGLADALDGEST
jgi:hypothetical protein